MNIELDLEDALIEEAKAFLPPHTSLQEVIEHCLKEWIDVRESQKEYLAARNSGEKNN